MKGFKLVPVEPTDEMLQAAYVEMSSPSCCVFDEVAYRAMLAAAPAPQYPAPVALVGGVGYVPLGWHDEQIDRVTAERDALQARLTASDERADVMRNLLLRTLAYYTESCFPEDLLLEIKSALKVIP